jgi:hypothetical protein
MHVVEDEFKEFFGVLLLVDAPLGVEVAADALS